MRSRSVHLLASTSLAALVFAIPALAQTAPAPATPQPLGPEDRNFIQKAAAGGTAEIDFAKMADQKSRNDGVKRFAQRMIRDHTRIGDQLAAIAASDGITVPATMDAEQQARQAELEKMSGARFDRAYIRGQVRDHRETIQLFRHEADSSHDQQLKSFASETLPVLRDHLKMADSVAAEMTPQARESGAGTAQSGSSMPPPAHDRAPPDGASALNREELQNLEATPGR